MKKSVELSERLRELALLRGPDVKLPTTRELCEQFSTSLETVNDALNHLESRQIIYRKHGHGIFVSPKLHKKFVRILFNSDAACRAGTSPFWGMFSGLIIQEAQRRAEQSGNAYSFELVAPPSGTESRLRDELDTLLSNGKVHGILAINMEDHLADWATEENIPFVAYAGWGNWMVGSDREIETRQAVSTLAELGCRRIGFWHHVFSMEEGKDGFDGSMIVVTKRVFESLGVPFYPEIMDQTRANLINRSNWRDFTYQEVGYLTARMAFQSSGPKPDGLYIDDDMVTSGVLTALREMNIRVGEELKIVTAANVGSPVLFGHEFELNLLEYDPAAIAACMFDVVDTLLAGQLPPQRFSVVPPKLVRQGERTLRPEILGVV